MSYTVINISKLTTILEIFLHSSGKNLEFGETGSARRKKWGIQVKLIILGFLLKGTEYKRLGLTFHPLFNIEPFISSRVKRMFRARGRKEYSCGNAFRTRREHFLPPCLILPSWSLEYLLIYFCILRNPTHIPPFHIQYLVWMGIQAESVLIQ